MEVVSHTEFSIGRCLYYHILFVLRKVGNFYSVFYGQALVWQDSNTVKIFWKTGRYVR